MKRNNKGVTLVELIVALAIIAIIMASVGTILYSSYKSFYTITKTSEYELIGDTLYDYVCDKIVLANNLSITSQNNITIDNVNTIAISATGRITYNNTNLYGDAFYGNKSVAMSVVKYNADSVSVYITVWQDGKQTYSVGSVIRMLNYKFPV